MRASDKKNVLKKKMLVSLLTVSMLVTYTGTAQTAGVVVHAAEKEEPVYEKIEISTMQDLRELAQNCHQADWSTDKMVILTGNIDFSETDEEETLYIPYFDGYFDGKGYTISNYKMTGSGYELGFFRYIGENAVVCNLTVTGSVIVEEEQQCIGGLCGVNNGIIRNCVFQGMVSGKNQTGGIVGMNDTKGVIQKCTAKGKVSGYYYTGGIAGKNAGLIDNCLNYANINDSGEWVAKDDENTLELLLDISQNSQKLKVQSGVDTGGIAGYSDGQIIRCTNQGIIGYERTGYNIGGIVGRQSGIVEYCTNAGTVYGRKDVGGIAGQVEPYIEINEAESVRAAVNKLHDLLEKTIDDMETGEDSIHADLENLQELSDGVMDTGDDIADGLTDYINNNTEQLNELLDRVDYVMDELPDVLDRIKNANTTLSDLNQVLDALRNDLDLQDKISQDTYAETNYKRLSLNLGIGGTLTADKSAPEEGAAVELNVTEDNGYALKKITALDANGKEISLTQTSYGKYTFLMPKENVLVSAEFSYEGAYLAETDAGGKLNIKTNQDGVTLTIEATAHDEYQLPGFVSIDGSQVALNNGKITINKEDYASIGEPVIVRAEFGSRDISGGSTTIPGDTHKIMKTAGTGGTVTTTLQNAKSGDTVYAVPVAMNGYRLADLQVKRMSDASTVSCNIVSGQYSFQMPDEDVYVEAVFKPIKLILLSNAGGSATYKGEDEAIVTLTVKPNAGYTVSKIPVVKNPAGNDIKVTKNSADTFVYRFSVPTAEEPATADITFTKQTENDAVGEATDRISENINALNALSEQISDAMQKLEDDLTNADGSFNKNNLTDEQTWNDLMDLLDYVTDAGEISAQILSDLNVLANIYGPYLKDASLAANDDLEEAIDIFEKITDILQGTGDKIRAVTDNLNARADVQLQKVNDKLQSDVDLIHEQLTAVSDCMGSLTEHADEYSKKVLDDFKAVNDQINVVFNLFVDDLTQTDASDVYRDISDEELDSAVTGVVSNSTNKGTIYADYNVGGICGSMAIDEEDPEDSAAGTVEKKIGSKYTALCIIKDSDNQGYVTARKDGAGGIVGYMRQGIVANAKSGGFVKSTEGGFVGGICGESYAVIRDCYALSMISGDKNVGGIAGYGTTITGCYSIANIMEANGRYGAIAGQAAEYKEQEEEEKRIANNYFVNNTVYGIDNISYVGAAEQISYEELIQTQGLPEDFKHLKVTFLMDGIEVGKTEIAYGESLKNLTYPEVPEQKGSYEVWPDVSEKIMTGNLVVEGEYADDIATLESDARVVIMTDGKEQEKPLMLADGTFTHEAELSVLTQSIYPDEKLAGKGEKATYRICLRSNHLGPEDITKIRVYNTKEEVTVWSYADGEWKEIPSAQKGQYLQFSIKGKEGVICVAEKVHDIRRIVTIAAYVAGCALLIFGVSCIIRKKGKKKKSHMEEENEV